MQLEKQCPFLEGRGSGPPVRGLGATGTLALCITQPDFLTEATLVAHSKTGRLSHRFTAQLCCAWSSLESGSVQKNGILYLMFVCLFLNILSYWLD